MSIVPDSNEPERRVDLISSPESPAPMPGVPEARADARAVPRLRTWIYVVVASLAAGMMAWGTGEMAYDSFGPSGRVGASDPRDFQALNRAKAAADQKNSAVTFGILGAFLGLLSGAAGGATRRSVAGGASAALVGLIVGGLAAAMAGYAISPIFGRYYSDESPSLLLPLLVRGGIWAIAGMAAGLAFGWGAREPRALPGALIGGLVGALLGTIAFEVANGLLFPTDRNDAVIPSSTTSRLLACLIVSAGVAIGAVASGRPRPMARTPQDAS